MSMKLTEATRLRRILVNKLEATQTAITALHELGSRYGSDLNAMALRDNWEREAVQLGTEIGNLNVFINNRLSVVEIS